MIAALSLNPSIDRTLWVDRLCPGGLNRVRAQRDVAAGKGVNVALAASVLGQRAECIGFMYRDGGAAFEQRLHENGVRSDFVWCEGAVRVNLKVFDSEKGEITELNQSGAPVNDELLGRMNDLVRSHARKADYMILSGSMPPACPVDYYRTLAEIASSEGCRVMLDADGERLRTGILAKPFLIKPNRYELELLAGHPLETTDQLLEAAEECIRAGVEAVVISLGGEGALLCCADGAWSVPGLKLEIKSTVAAGDSMLAGVASGLSDGLSLPEAFRLGAACASARCVTPPEEMICAETVRSLCTQLQLEKLR